MFSFSRTGAHGFGAVRNHVDFCMTIEQKFFGGAAHEEDNGEQCSMAVVEVSAFKYLQRIRKTNTSL